ncbi:hypothetical protein PsorP6_016054 [Peronosclerospora sorghi]|uniref:Uncharacterized protein n=1 Tax=Peronosclerospora sorghi TaxID=230839 RepID=A0ACC0WR82_9STRA|nr:hypothetical protein PsorP6_016054 [Peronosclerospora sorghi]
MNLPLFIIATNSDPKSVSGVMMLRSAALVGSRAGCPISTTVVLVAFSKLLYGRPQGTTRLDHVYLALCVAASTLGHADTRSSVLDQHCIVC